MHRLATLDDLPRIQSIERAAGEAFRSVGMDAIAEDEPIGEAEFGRFVASGGAWVACGSGGAVVAYLLTERVDSTVHVEQVTVHPEFARRGLGAGLIDVAATWARDKGLYGLTLTTFRDVPWNAPYYRRLGFTELLESQWGPDLTAKVARESAAGLSRWPRVVMVRPAPS